MPLSSLQIVPTVNAERTPTLNEAGIVSSDLIRFKDSLPQKLGGWQKFYGFQIDSLVREMHAWEGLNADAFLGIGATNSLTVVVNGSGFNVTPQYDPNNPPPDFSTTLNSNIVTVVDTGSSNTINDVAIIYTPVSVGGLVIHGAYQIVRGGTDDYDIIVPHLATATVSHGGTIPTFTSFSGSSTVTVVQTAHGFNVGDTETYALPTVIAGITIQGTYSIATVIDANTYTISTNRQANANATVSMNGGVVNIVYWIGIAAPPVGGGFGIGGFGLGGFGTGTPSPPRTGNSVVTIDWSLDNWGSFLLACPEDGPIFYWDPTAQFRSVRMIPQAPIANGGMFVAMPQQQIVAYAASVNVAQDPMLVAWCDVSDFTVWTAASTNQAGTYRIPRGSKIVGGMQGPQQALLWTDLAIWSMQYIGYPDVYGFNEIASGCGLISKHAAGVIGTEVYWMSQTAFYKLGGGGVTMVDCSVWDTVFRNLDRANLRKIRVAVNSMFGEVTWHFPTIGGDGENDSYVKFNVATGSWDQGVSMRRTAWIDQGVLGSPVGAGVDRYVYQHETSNDADGLAMNAKFRTGYFMIQDGEDYGIVDRILPDFKWGEHANVNATLLITIFVVDYPGGTERVYGPFTVSRASKYVSKRMRGRQLSLQFESKDLDSFWRLGRVRYRWAPDGRR